MAEEPEESDDEEEEEEEEEDDDEIFSDYALLGFRLFQTNIIGEVHDSEDMNQEDEFEAPDEYIEEEEPKPSSYQVTQKLIEQGVTMEQLVKCLLTGCHEEYENNDEYTRVDDEIFGKMRIIISNFAEQIVEPEQIAEPQTILRVNPIQPPEVDFSAQPKHIVRRIMMHV